MKYDIYRGTEEDFKNSDGIRIAKGVSEEAIRAIIDDYAYISVDELGEDDIEAFIVSGEFILSNDYETFLWAEEAM